MQGTFVPSKQRYATTVFISVSVSCSTKGQTPTGTFSVFDLEGKDTVRQLNDSQNIGMLLHLH